MSDVAIGRGSRGEGTFRPATIILVVAIGIVAFAGMLILGAYAPDLRSGRNGGAHALSNAATGFSGIVRLARATGRNPQIQRSDLTLDTEDLVVLTPETGETEMGRILARRPTRPTLVVLPKWITVPDRARAGWVRAQGLRPPSDPERTLAPAHPLKVERHRGGGRLETAPGHAPPELRFSAPGPLQTASGPALKPIVTDKAGRIVLGQFGSKPLYLLADPDLLSNHGIADRSQAAAALAMLDFLNATDAGSVVFDVTLNGLGQTRSPLKLMFDPPFLAATLALAAALLLAGLQALSRFGPPRRPERAIAFGKKALIDNSAALVRQARREAGLGGRYAEMIREKAVTVFAVPARLRDGGVTDYLDKLDGRASFSALASAAEEARTRDELLAAAQALHRWQGEKKR
ncbi:MAG TPA: DUF4350 domain-containing protein [Allosphingosinicella sp.]|jgi:hypothetical protein|nr:DUF4350 domain-containing protein [Allosphingosinicella sp.]